MKRCILLVPLLVALGCGGSGGGAGVTNAAVAHFLVDKKVINYGESVALTLTTADPVRAGQNVTLPDGSKPSSWGDTQHFTDAPAITTTYLANATNSVTGDIQGYRHTVTVRKTTKRYVNVGATTESDVTWCKAHVEELSSVAPVVSTTIPSDLSPFDVLVLCEGGTFGPSDRPQVEAFLASDKGVVVIGSAARRLATGIMSDPNTSILQPWLGIDHETTFFGNRAPVSNLKCSGIAKAGDQELTYEGAHVAQANWSGITSYGYFGGHWLATAALFTEPPMGGRAFYMAYAHNGDSVFPANGPAWDYLVKSHLQWVAH